MIAFNLKVVRIQWDNTYKLLNLYLPHNKYTNKGEPSPVITVILS